MKMNEPLGSFEFGPFLIRLALGSYFVIAGFLKLENLPAFIEEVHKFGILGKDAGRLYGTLLPYLEIGAGTLVVFGFWTTMASMILSILLISFIIALKFFPNSNYLFNKDIILLVAAISLMYTGPGVVSMDRFRRSGD